MRRAASASHSLARRPHTVDTALSLLIALYRDRGFYTDTESMDGETEKGTLEPGEGELSIARSRGCLSRCAKLGCSEDPLIDLN